MAETSRTATNSPSDVSSARLLRDRTKRRPSMMTMNWATSW